MSLTNIKNSVSRILAIPGLSVTFTFDGQTYTGVKSTLKRQDVNSDGGLAGSYVFSLLCPLAEFTSVLPAPRRSRVTVEGKTYRVLTTEKDAVAASIRLNLGDVTE